jgi:osmotically-inducible protein OsmY
MTSMARLAVAVLLVSTSLGCGTVKPYPTEAPPAPEPLGERLADDELAVELRKALLEQGQGEVVHVSPYVYRGHVYVVGWVSGAAERDRVLALAKQKAGTRPVDSYLPERPAGTTGQKLSGDTADDVVVEQVRSALARVPAMVLPHVTVVSLAGHVVLLGVVASEDDVAQAEAAATGVPSVTGVTNFLLASRS